jgi:probable rRNA maturation factor
LVILQKKVPGLSENSLARFVLRARRAAGLRGVVNILVTDGSAVRSLNRNFRGQNKATDVLSFPSLPELRPRSAPAGDIAISADMALSSATRIGHSAADEVKILTLHGVLHLAGFDHEHDDGKMARKEAALRRKLGLPDGLIERAHSLHKSSTPTKRRAAAARSSA